MLQKSRLYIDYSDKEQSVWDLIPVSSDIAELRDIIRDSDDWATLTIDMEIIGTSSFFHIALYSRGIFDYKTFENITDLKGFIERVKSKVNNYYGRS